MKDLTVTVTFQFLGDRGHAVQCSHRHRTHSGASRCMRKMLRRITSPRSRATILVQASGIVRPWTMPAKGGES